MNDFEMTLNSPLTSEDWAKITDANMEHTQSVTFQTKGGKKVEFVKVVRCQDCKHHACCGYEDVEDWFCADGERRDSE